VYVITYITCSFSQLFFIILNEHKHNIFILNVYTNNNFLSSFNTKWFIYMLKIKNKCQLANLQQTLNVEFILKITVYKLINK